ncbi:hypothetical protein [Botrimarina sp.]|uniref:hypothetical protein n=1 Tax=Botrimarina sp. TaxID=2795802 RepID=UPI0032EC38E5
MAFKDTYTIDSSGAERALANLNKLIKEQEGATGKAVKQLTAEERAIRSIAEKAEPVRRVNRKFEELAQMVAQGKVGIEDAAKVAQKYQRQLDRTGDSGKRAFGESAVLKLGTYAAGLISVNTALSAGRQLYQAITQAADQAVERARAAIDAVGELQQLANFSGNKELATDLVRRGIANDMAQGAGIAFQLGSSGVKGAERDFLIEEVAAPKLVAPGNLATFAAKVKKAQGTLGFGSFQNTTQKILQASEATDTDATSIATASTRFGSELGALGFSGDSGLAALTTIIQQSPNQDIAANRLRAFLGEVDKKGLGKGTLRETIAAIQSRVDAGAEESSILTNSRSLSGFRNLRDQLEFFDQQQGLIASAPERDVVGQRAGELAKDPVFGAQLAADEARGRRLVAETAELAPGAALRQAIEDEGIARAHEGGNRFAAGVGYAGGWMNDMAAFAYGDRAYLQAELDADTVYEQQTGKEGMSQGLEDQIRAYLKRTAEASERSADAAEGGANPGGE